MQFAGVPPELAKIDQQNDRVTLQFDRTAPFSAVLSDQLQLELGATPIGSYTLTLHVTDIITARTTSRTTHFVIRNYLNPLGASVVFAE